MPLEEFTCTDFRCLESVQLELDSEFTLITGANASGKTSLLEAIAYLGRGRSFRGAGIRDLVRHGCRDFVLRGMVRGESSEHRMAVRNGARGRELRLDGDKTASVAPLAVLLPLQVVDPEVHQLVAGPPEGRRRFLDWIGFHVEHGFLDCWRNFRRALRQRNALLKSGGGALPSWDREFVAQAEALDRLRQTVAGKAVPVLEQTGAGLLGTAVGFEYQRGWSAERPLSAVLSEARERDLQQGTSTVGPHRADLRLRVDERLARRLVSRGQQKLLAAAMVLGSVELVRTALDRGPLLLLDDPAAELDRQSLDGLMAYVAALECQVIATSLTAESLPGPPAVRRFHVEQGMLAPA